MSTSGQRLGKQSRWDVAQIELDNELLSQHGPDHIMIPSSSMHHRHHLSLIVSACHPILVPQAVG